MNHPETWCLAAALGLMLSACGDPTDIVSIQAHVTGHVTDASGAPVEGAAVHIQAIEPSNANVIVDETVSTGADGGFATTLRAALVAPHVTNIALTASPPPGAVLAPRTLSGLSVAFSLEDPPVDTLQVEVSLDSP
jgi:hypothetical protein